MPGVGVRMVCGGNTHFPCPLNTLHDGSQFQHTREGYVARIMLDGLGRTMMQPLKL